jgi:hypothetical protein
MPRHVFTRQELYERVWNEPMRTIASSIGVSDVGLAKACRAARIPVPPRGWWAKRHHGKPLPLRPPLPPRPEGEDVRIAPPAPRPEPSAAVVEAAAEAIEGPEIRIAQNLRTPHPIVDGWLYKDAERRRDYRRRGWSAAGLEDLTTPLARRRLRITSTLLKALEVRGFGIGEDREWLVVRLGEDAVHFRIYVRSKIVHRPATPDELRWQPERKKVRATVLSDELTLKIRDWVSVPTEYRELKTPLEDQLPQIVANLAAAVADQRVRREQRELEHQRWLEAEAIRKKQQAYREAEMALRQRLGHQADRHAKAEAIRAYVAAADASPAAQHHDYAAWREWALEQADAIDPLVDGSIPFSRLPPIEQWSWRGW